MPYSLPSAVRIALLRAARGADVAERPSHTHRLVRATWRSGVSVLIPERGTPHLLARALRHLQVALAPDLGPEDWRRAPQ